MPLPGASRWTRASLAMALVAGATCAQSPGYSRDVRPILAENCFLCHGPDEGTRKADLRLDVPGHGKFAELLRRVATDDSGEVMPPPHTGKSLTRGDVETLRRWIDGGAAYERHWAFVAPTRPTVPDVVDGGPHPIDRFVQRGLDAVGLSHSPQADRATLIRRVYLDLIGLPPTPEQVDAFVSDDEPDAYERLVDSLLESPHYGERWARRWLDLARYADTNGYEKDRTRSIWPYRDWVIRALNADMPFDEFTVHQLAGDMLPDASAESLIATGFHRNTMLNEEGGIDPLEFRFHAINDRTATTGTVFLGLTMGCAQCHTHKFDPITHTEYFGLLAYLNNADEPDYLIPDAGAEARERANREQAERALGQLWDKWPKDAPPRDGRFAEWLELKRQQVVVWTPLQPVRATSNLPTLTVAADGSGTVDVSGDTTKHDVYRLAFAASDRPVTALRLEALPDDRLPARGPGLTYYEGRKGDFFLSEIGVSVGHGEDAVPIAIARATESFARNQYSRRAVGAALALDGDLQTGWSTHTRHGERHVAVFQFTEPIPAGQPFAVEMHFGRHFASSLGRFRMSSTDRAGQVEALALPFDEDGALEAVLQKSADARTEDQRRQLRDAFLLEAAEVAKPAQRIRGQRRRTEHQTTMILRERRPGFERPTHRHHRGEFLQPREVVGPHLPEVLAVGDPPRDRLGLARWLVSSDNPLTARVIVNRQWAAFFGRGLVVTVDDFGAQGALPSHPELLDWLAVEFMAGEWRLKRLHRLIVTSATYRQVSHVAAEHLARDPDNRWLSRAPRFRLEAEILRDALLVAAGKLSTKKFGPPVRPPQPAGVTEVAYGRPKWRPSKGEDRFRRSIYTFQKRTAPFAFHATFDAPSGEACIARRDVSNSPLQALTLLNDPMVIELAQALGEQLVQVERERDRSAALESAFRRVLSRSPTRRELRSLHDFVERQRERSKPAVAWAALARVLFSLDEASTRN